MTSMGRFEARLPDAIVAVLIGELAIASARPGGFRRAWPRLGAGACLALALRSALRDGAAMGRLLCLAGALACHLADRRS